MHFVRYMQSERARVGKLDGDDIIPWSSPTLAEALNGHGSATGPAIKLSAVRLLPALDPMAKILCVALNYHDHAKEAKQPLPATPLLFFKAQDAMIAAGEPIAVPPIVTELDYEGELAVIIGRPAYRIAEDDAWDYIAGVAPFNDGSSRNLLNVKAGERTHLDWFSAKCLQSSTPMGPAAAQKHDLLQRLKSGDIRVATLVNGKTRQDAPIADMIFDIPKIVAFASSRISLNPGDVIATGTPPGVGFATGQYLKSGDVVEIKISGLPTLSNPVA